jgi:hypothetical protein
VPHFSQVTSFVSASVTVTLYFAPQLQVCIPVSHSTNSVILRICAPTHPFSSELSGFHRAIARSAVKVAADNFEAFGNAIGMGIPTVHLRKPSYAGLPAIGAPKSFNPMLVEDVHLPEYEPPAGRIKRIFPAGSGEAK